MIPDGAIGDMVRGILNGGVYTGCVPAASVSVRQDPAVSGELPVFREELRETGPKAMSGNPTLSANTSSRK